MSGGEPAKTALMSNRDPAIRTKRSSAYNERRDGLKAGRGCVVSRGFVTLLRCISKQIGLFLGAAQ
jgi:hypothetical protein